MFRSAVRWASRLTRALVKNGWPFQGEASSGNAALVKIQWRYLGVSKNRGTWKWMVCSGKSYFSMDDLGGKPPIFGNTHLFPITPVKFLQFHLQFHSELGEVIKKTKLTRPNIYGWKNPKIGGSFPPKWMVYFMVPTLFLNGWFGGFSHYFWFNTHIADLKLNNSKAQNTRNAWVESSGWAARSPSPFSDAERPRGRSRFFLVLSSKVGHCCHSIMGT